MGWYPIRMPNWVQQLMKKRIWKSTPLSDLGAPVLYLSFDDGPHPQITPWVLDQLKEFGAKAIFFCIGDNVRQFPEVYERILREGHLVGNHTMNHWNGWKVGSEKYLHNVWEAKALIDSVYFRPPYGKMNGFQEKALLNKGFEIVMWTVLSGDFDEQLAPERCAHQVILAAQPGDIVVFHDSEKAYPRLKIALPKILQHFKSSGYEFHHL